MYFFTLGTYLVGSCITVTCVFLSLILFCKKKHSSVVLSNGKDQKTLGLGTWMAGVFVAGTGVALMYAPADLVGYVKQGLSPIESILMLTLLNGATVWALYAIVGLWYMKNMDSKIGKLAAMLSTVLGMSVSLWTGMNTVARFIGFDISGFKFFLAALTVLISIVSAKYGYFNKMSRLAFFIFVIAFLSLVATPITSFSIVPISGKITKLFFKEFFIGSTAASWNWWFISWTFTVARFLAHISNGRTIREYIAGTIIIPTILAIIWMTTSWIYQDVIMSFNLMKNFRCCIPAIIFIISGILFMTGTLDSDCKVFTEDLEILSKGKLSRESNIPFYGLFVLFLFCLYNSGIVKNPFAFNEYSSLIFLPLLVMAIINSIKMIWKNK